MSITGQLFTCFSGYSQGREFFNGHTSSYIKLSAQHVTDCGRGCFSSIFTSYCLCVEVSQCVCGLFVSENKLDIESFWHCKNIDVYKMMHLFYCLNHKVRLQQWIASHHNYMWRFWQGYVLLSFQQTGSIIRNGKISNSIWFLWYNILLEKHHG